MDGDKMKSHTAHVLQAFQDSVTKDDALYENLAKDYLASSACDHAAKVPAKPLLRLELLRLPAPVRKLSN